MTKIRRVRRDQNRGPNLRLRVPFLGWTPPSHLHEMERVVFLIQNPEPSAQKRIARLVRRVQVAQPITALETVADAEVEWVQVVVHGRQDPFAQAEYRTWFENTRDAGINSGEGVGMNGRFDGVGRIKALIGEWELLGIREKALGILTVFHRRIHSWFSNL